MSDWNSTLLKTQNAVSRIFSSDSDSGSHHFDSSITGQFPRSPFREARCALYLPSPGNTACPAPRVTRHGRC